MSGLNLGGLTLSLGGNVSTGDTTAPTITSTNSASVAENATLSKSLTANESVTWTITGGADAARFEISGSTLRWLSNGTKDYEAPDDADTNNTYVVQVTATDAALNASNQTITVTVTDVAEGSVWTGTPRAGSPLATNGPTSNGTSLTVTLAPHEIGDLLLVIIATDSDATVTITGWTALSNGTNSTNVRLKAYVRDTVAASNAETNPTFTISAAQQGSAIAYSIPGGDPAKAVAATSSAATNTAPDPPALTPGGTADYLYIAYFGADNNSSLTTTGYPTGYSNELSAWNGNTESTLIAAAQKATTASTTDNPSAFALSGTEQYVVCTLAVWP